MKATAIVAVIWAVFTLPTLSLSTQTSTNICELALRAEQGDAEAHFTLGGKYLLGEGVQENDEEAAGWYRAAALQGHTEAQFNLGVMYVKSMGPKPDRVQAYAWFSMAASSGPGGHGDAQRVCRKNDVRADRRGRAVVARVGGGGPMKFVRLLVMLALISPTFPQVDPLLLIDDVEDPRWYEADSPPPLGEDFAHSEAVWEAKKAAEQNDPEAQYVLGGLYERWPSVRPSKMQAYFWYFVAAENGHKEAAVARDRVAKRMTPKRIARVEWMVKEWKGEE